MLERLTRLSKGPVERTMSPSSRLCGPRQKQVPQGAVRRGRTSHVAARTVRPGKRHSQNGSRIPFREAPGGPTNQSIVARVCVPGPTDPMVSGITGRAWRAPAYRCDACSACEGGLRRRAGQLTCPTAESRTLSVRSGRDGPPLRADTTNVCARSSWKLPKPALLTRPWRAARPPRAASAAGASSTSSPSAPPAAPGGSAR